jgi:hypothetical protein
MPNRPTATRRWLTALSWPFGIALTSWDYMWRTTPMHRREEEVTVNVIPELMRYPAGVSSDEVQGQEVGSGPLFHRRYRTRIRGSSVSADALMAEVQADVNRAAPTTFARFHRVHGERGLAIGDEYVVRMPGPWDGPVRVVAVGPRAFRLATLAGHLEAGQIEFRAEETDEGELGFAIESWARSSSAIVNILYHRLRMAKEVQAHMWISFLERVVEISRGKMAGGIEIETRRVTIIGDRPEPGSTR